MQTALQAILTGVFLGGLYGLISCGLSLTFGVTRVTNFAHGDFVTLGMYGAFVGQSALGLHPLLSLPFVAAAAFGLGVALHGLLISRTVKQKVFRPDDTHISQIVVTFALGLLIQNVLLLIFSPNSRSVTGVFEGVLRVGGLFVNRAQLFAFVLALVVFAVLYLFLKLTSFGRAMTATVDDADMAAMVGIDPGRIYAVSLGIGVALAAVAGTILVTYYPATPTAGAAFVAIAFITVVLGGMGNVLGAFLAGPLIGVAQQLTATYAGLDLQNVGLFAVFLLVLLLRPSGLLGRQAAK
jgi:branched-chain amino acid transport system permease protein